MKERFREVRLGSDKLLMVLKCNRIIGGYQAAGMKLTLRQLYYQLVTVNAITNEDRSYKWLGGLLSDARLAGLVDWDAIEDRVRVPREPMEFNDVADLMDAAVNSYRLRRWDNQDFYVELWVEKDAISSVLSPLTRKYHVTLMVNRGYSSQSAMYGAAQRYKNASGDGLRECVLLYLGDHDPSGEDMVRDIGARLEMFGATVDVVKIGLTMQQVKQYKPPPNPAKVSDSRYTAYVEKYGDKCWEVDALRPEVLARLVSSSIERYIDYKIWDRVLAREESDKKRLLAFARSMVKKGGK